MVTTIMIDAVTKMRLLCVFACFAYAVTITIAALAVAVAVILAVAAAVILPDA